MERKQQNYEINEKNASFLKLWETKELRKREERTKKKWFKMQ